MTRYSATLVHFSISLFVGLMMLAVVWFVYYPSPMLVGFGGLEIFLLIVTIDVILGPLLTLVVFNKTKKNLFWDLTVIAVLQVTALSYGAMQLFAARPVYVAALDNEFHVIQATEITEQNLQKSGSHLPLFGPIWVGTAPPTDQNKLEEVKLVAQLVDGGLGHFPQYHSPLSGNVEQLINTAKTIDDLELRHGVEAAKVNAWLVSNEVATLDAVYVPTKIQSDRYATVLNKKTRTVIGITPFRLRE
jgi:hypothetical protein